MGKHEEVYGPPMTNNLLTKDNKLSMIGISVPKYHAYKFVYEM